MEVITGVEFNRKAASQGHTTLHRQLRVKDLSRWKVCCTWAQKV